MFIRGQRIGSGSYGRVYECEHESDKYAVKRNLISKSVDFIGSVKELDLLHKVKTNQSSYLSQCTHYFFVCPFKEPPSPLSPDMKDDKVYFVFNRASMNLHDFIKSHHNFKPLKWMMLNILMALEVLHYNNIVHLDLKPTNILVDIKDDKYTAILADFGMSRFITKQYDQTGLPITSWYRAPEMCSKRAIQRLSSDIWSLGCIFFEMVFRTCIMAVKSDDDSHDVVLKNIISKHPKVTQADLKSIISDNGKIAEYMALKSEDSSWMARIDTRIVPIFEEYVGRFDLFQDLLNKMLAFNPDKRITASQALVHPFFQEYKTCICVERLTFVTSMADLYYTIPPVSDRELILPLINDVYKARNDVPWYSDQILIHTMEFYDRYLLYEYNLRPRKLIDEHKNTRLMKFNICLYLAIKYFQHDSRLSFSHIAKLTISELDLANFELYLLEKVLGFNLFVWTWYEYADKFDIKWTNDQLRLYFTRWPEIISNEFNAHKNAVKLLDFFYDEK